MGKSRKKAYAGVCYSAARRELWHVAKSHPDLAGQTIPKIPVIIEMAFKVKGRELIAKSAAESKQDYVYRCAVHLELIQDGTAKRVDRKTRPRAPRMAPAVRAAFRASARADIPADEGMSVREARLKDFYDSWEWKRVRYAVLKERGRKCECCNASAEHGVRIVVDHIKPLRFNWDLRLDPANLQVLCDDCNMGKGSRDETDWRVAAE